MGCDIYVPPAWQDGKALSSPRWYPAGLWGVLAAVPARELGLGCQVFPELGRCLPSITHPTGDLELAPALQGHATPPHLLTLRFPPSHGCSKQLPPCCFGK